MAVSDISKGVTRVPGNPNETLAKLIWIILGNLDQRNEGNGSFVVNGKGLITQFIKK